MRALVALGVLFSFALAMVFAQASHGGSRGPAIVAHTAAKLVAHAPRLELRKATPSAPDGEFDAPFLVPLATNAYSLVASRVAPHARQRIGHVVTRATRSPRLSRAPPSLGLAAPSH